MPTTIGQLRLSSLLEERLQRNRRIWDGLVSLLGARPSAQGAGGLKSMSLSIREYLKLEPRLIDEWDGVLNLYDRLAVYGPESSVNTVSALILASAAIAMPGLTLRPDLDPSIVNARRSHWGSTGGGPGGGVPGDGTVTPMSLPSALSPFEQSLERLYKTLLADINPAGALATRISTLLTDRSKVLRVGADMTTLKLSQIQKYADLYFRSATHLQRTGGIQPGSETRPNTSFAPTTFQLKAPEFYCHAQSEVTSDEVFWVSVFAHITNLEEVYAKIDSAIRSGTAATLQLSLGTDIKHALEVGRSPLVAGCSPSNTPHNYGLNLGPFRMHQGFFPWSCAIKCIEDDDAEYEAVSEVIGKIGDAASDISMGASIVATVAGPTVVGAGAAVVAEVSADVALACDVAEAVVDIVNYFDDDDFIGRIEVTSSGDYLTVGENLSNPLSRDRDTTGGNTGGHYSIRTQEYFGPTEAVDRLWRVYTEYKWGEEHKHAGILGCGNSGDTGEKLQFSRRMDACSGVVQCSDNGHAEWSSGPSLVDNNTGCEGTVHWGVRGHHTVKYTAGALGFAFLPGGQL